jgi:hypothetical protein
MKVAYWVATNLCIDRTEKKNKNIAFISNTDEEDVQCDMDTNESFSDAIVLLGRKFNKVLKKMDRKSRPDVKKMQFEISKNSGLQRKGRIACSPKVSRHALRQTWRT